MPQIKIENLHVAYEKKKKTVVTVIDDLSLTFKDGYINVIIGPSGCGKTTLLKAIIGNIEYKGNIYFNDINVDQVPIKLKNLCLVNQNIVLYPNMTVFNNIASPLKFVNADYDEIRERVNQIAEKFGITHLLSRKPKQISIGQAQKVSIARAMIKKPELYLFDEPFSNLDYQYASELRTMISKIIKEEGGTAIYITHDIKEATALGDYIYVMEDGNIIEEGTPTQILDSKKKLVMELVHEDNIDEII